MTLSLPLSDSAVVAMAEAIYSKTPVVVVETDSFDSEPRTFATVVEFCEYAVAQKAAACGSVHVAVLYPDMEGRLAQTRREYVPDNGIDVKYGVSVAGWGLIRVHLDLKGGRPLGSWVSAYSQKRAEKCAVTYPELDSPSIWNWIAVKSHERRLARVLKKFA
jgi:hypothetical protein